MKKILINSLQENKLVKLMREAMMDGFSFEKLKSLPSFSAKKRYCDEMLGEHVGKGSSRIVYQLNDEWVLKLAFNAKGVAQNEEEYSNAIDSYMNIGVNVDRELTDTDDFSFLVSEFVLPAKAEDFKRVFGLTFKDFVKFILSVAQQYSGSRRYSYVVTFSGDELEELRDNNEDLDTYANYLENYQPHLGDMERIANYGLTHRNGYDEIVLLDSGLNDEIFNKFYKRW